MHQTYGLQHPTMRKEWRDVLKTFLKTRTIKK